MRTIKKVKVGEEEDREREKGREAEVKEHSTDCPPKSCMPSRAKTTMKRKSRKSKLMIDFIELRRDTTRLRNEAQYLTKTDTKCVFNSVQYYVYDLNKIKTVIQQTHFVTLKILNNLRARNTLMPNDVPGWMMDHSTSNILPHIT